MALTDGELEVTGLEKPALSGRKAVLVDAGKDLLGRTGDDAPLRMEARRGDRAGDESYGDQESAEDCSCSGNAG